MCAEEYVWKEDTRVGEQFEFGSRLLKRNCEKDWDKIKEEAMQGKLQEIPADIFIRYYSSLTRIAADFAKPVGVAREVWVFYGPTGSGKSRRAFEEAGEFAYPKDPRSKFWYGYQGQENVVIDEFRGGIDISHMLRWLDRYPVMVEIKGSSRSLNARKLWITSNLHPESWYPDLDRDTYRALERRLVIEEMK